MALAAVVIEGFVKLEGCLSGRGREWWGHESKYIS